MNKAVGIGACVMDTLINMPNYPKEDTKMRAESSKQAGGGPVATGLVAPARLGAETEYIGVLSDDAGGRQRTAANQIFTRLLRSCAAEKDAVRIPQTPKPPYDFQTVWACFENSGFPNE